MRRTTCKNNKTSNLPESEFTEQFNIPNGYKGFQVERQCLRVQRNTLEKYLDKTFPYKKFHFHASICMNKCHFHFIWGIPFCKQHQDAFVNFL